MQITANQTPFSLITQTSQTTKDLAASVPPDTQTTETNTPASIVNFSGLREASDLYEQPKLVDIVQMSNAQDKGAAAIKASQTLAADSTNLRQSKSPFSPSNFLSQIGALSRETASYKNAAFSYQFGSTKAAEKLKLSFADTGGKPQETVTLRVRTKDGDSIDIKIQHSKSAIGDNMEFSFDVTGKLSTAEQDALEKLANKLGQVADDFFRTGTTELHGLKEFDQANLQDFHVEFSKPKADSYTTLSYDFSVDEKTQTQHLSAKDGDGYSLDITANLQDLLGTANPSFNRSLENYLTIIRKTLNEHNPLQQEHSNSASMQFIIDGFTSMLSPSAARSDSPANSHAEKVLNAFDTGLPDFTAVINAPLYIYKDPKRKLEIPENMTLKLEQRTQSEAQADGSLLIKQVNSFERQSRQIEGILGSDKGDLTTGNFNYKTVHEKQQTSRILDLTQDEVNNLITEYTSSIDITVESYRNFKLKDIQKEEHKDRQAIQLADEISKHQQFKQVFDSLKYIADSTKKLFF